MIDLRIVCVSVKVTKLSKYICIRIIQELIIVGYCGSLLSRVVGLKHPFRNPSDILVQSRRLLARLIALFRNDQSAISDSLSSRGCRTAAIRDMKAASNNIEL